MKKYLLYLLAVPLFFCCSKDEQRRNTNPFLPDYSFSVDINLNLPSYSNLNSPFNGLIIYPPNGGIKGLVVMKISDTDYRAWEAACPNQYPTESCSLMKITESDKINTVCPCDNLKYSIATGVGDGAPYTMKPYSVEVRGNMLRIYN